MGNQAILVAYYDGKDGNMNEVVNDYSTALSEALTVAEEQVRLHEYFNDMAGAMRNPDGTFGFWQTHETDVALNDEGDHAVEGSLFKVENVDALMALAIERLDFDDEERRWMIGEFRSVGWLN